MLRNGNAFGACCRCVGEERQLQLLLQTLAGAVGRRAARAVPVLQVDQHFTHQEGCCCQRDVRNFSRHLDRILCCRGSVPVSLLGWDWAWGRWLGLLSPKQGRTFAVWASATGAVSGKPSQQL